MSAQDQNQSKQHPHNQINDTHESTSKTEQAEGVGENEENHTSGDHIQYQRTGKDSQNETGGEDGKKVHTDNRGGNTNE